MTRRRHDALPPTLAPLGLSLEEAAAYVGISAGLFDRLVAEKQMPAPAPISPHATLPHTATPPTGCNCTLRGRS